MKYILIILTITSCTALHSGQYEVQTYKVIKPGLSIIKVKEYNRKLIIETDTLKSGKTFNLIVKNK